MMNIMPINSIQTNNYSNKQNKPAFGMNLSKDTLFLIKDRPDIFSIATLEKLNKLQIRPDGCTISIYSTNPTRANAQVRVNITDKDSHQVYHDLIRECTSNWSVHAKKELEKKVDFLSSNAFLKLLKKHSEQRVKKAIERIQKIALIKTETQKRNDLIAQIEERANAAELSNRQDQALLDSVVPNFHSPEMTKEQARGIAVGLINAGVKDVEKLKEIAKTLNPSSLEQKFEELEQR